MVHEKIVKFADFEGGLSSKFMTLFCKILLNFIFKDFGFSDFNGSNLTKFIGSGALPVYINKFGELAVLNFIFQNLTEFKPVKFD